MSRSDAPLPPTRLDVALAAGIGAASLVELHSTWAFERVPLSGPEWIHYVAVVGASAALVWRRAHPLLVAPVVIAILLAQPLVSEIPNTYGEVVIAVLATYAMTAYGRGRGLLVSIPVLLMISFVLGLSDKEDPIGVGATNVVVGLVLLGLGAVVRRTRERAERMEDERDQADARATEIAWVERERIARELHDVVAHGMSVVVLQARGGRRMLDTDSERAEQAFDDIERVAARCLDEMRRLVGILRTRDPEALPLAPQPGIDDVRGLVDQARDSGATVELTVSGQPRDLAPALELTAYRIAQEGLTNAIKHAPGSRTHVRIDYGSSALTVSVTDDGPGPRPHRHSGHGLIGMRERVELFGGAFRAGPGTGGGFDVHAEIPVDGAEA